jgi:hypothetical protein
VVFLLHTSQSSQFPTKNDSGNSSKIADKQEWKFVDKRIVKQAVRAKKMETSNEAKEIAKLPIDSSSYKSYYGY